MTPTEGPSAAPSPRRGPRPANARLRRLLVMLPWLMERDETPVAEVASRFQLTEAEVVTDLERAAMCGLPPYGPGDLIDLFIDEGVIYIGQRQFLTRPLRLTAPEGFSLLVAGRAALQLPGGELADSLRTALDKLAAALGDGAIEVEMTPPALAGALTDAVESGEVLSISYWSPTSEEVTERLIHPLMVFADRGHWYVSAFDESRRDERTFRIDRIERMARTGATFQRTAPYAAQPTWFADADELPRVTLRLDQRARWVAERYPLETIVATNDAGVTVTMAVTSEGWLRRVLLRAGSGAQVVAPDRWLTIGADAANATLRRYRSTILPS